MALTIWKYVLEVKDGPQTFEATKDADTLFVANEDGNLCVWARLDPADKKDTLIFHVFGTGHPIPAGLYYVGSALMGPFVWHVFES